MRDEREWMDWLREYRVAVTKTHRRERKEKIPFCFALFFGFVIFFIGSVGQRVRQIGLMGRGVFFFSFFSWFRSFFFCRFRLSDNPFPFAEHIWRLVKNSGGNDRACVIKINKKKSLSFLPFILLSDGYIQICLLSIHPLPLYWNILLRPLIRMMMMLILDRDLFDGNKPNNALDGECVQQMGCCLCRGAFRRILWPWEIQWADEREEKEEKNGRRGIGIDRKNKLSHKSPNLFFWSIYLCSLTSLLGTQQHDAFISNRLIQQQQQQQQQKGAWPATLYRDESQNPSDELHSE